MPQRVLVVDGDRQCSGFLAELLYREGFRVHVCLDLTAALRVLPAFTPEHILFELCSGTVAAELALSRLRQAAPSSRIFALADASSVEAAVRCVQLGAAGYVMKPFRFAELLDLLRVSRPGDRPATADDAPTSQQSVRSAAMREVMDLARRAARQANGLVLLLGESGTGKDYLASWIHHHSPRCRGPMVSVNCAALPKALAESELFGHEAGSFTGTRGRKRGLVELAEGGTLLLNEIGELVPSIQSKLLTFLDTRCFRRVGGEETLTVDARIFAATNRDLREEVERGTFRRDLFYRLDVFPIHLVPLRDRREDLPALAEERLAILARDMGLFSAPKLTGDARRMLEAYHWPGNVRELWNVLERALLLSDGEVIAPRHFALSPAAQQWKVVIPFAPGDNYHNAVKIASRKLIAEALRRSRSKQDAARILGLSRHALAHRMKSLGLDD